MKAEQFITKFNELRKHIIEVHNTFTKNQLVTILKENGFPNIWCELRSNGVFEYISGGKHNGPEIFRFTRPDKPTHVDLLQKVFDVASSKRYKANKKYREKKESQNIKVFSDITEEKAVAFLKDLGYKVYKPVTSYEEV